MTAPLSLFWYRSEANFGDALSPLVVAHLAGRPVTWASVDRAEMVALGSLMTMVSNGHGGPRSPKPVLWGTGVMGPVPRDLLDHVDIAAVRGPRTAEVLGLHGVPYGDPGLFAPEIMGSLPARQDHVGIVPHLTKRQDPELQAAVARDPRLILIDPATTDARAVMHQIASCAYILSSSLHGLVTADACGIPNTWMVPDGNHGHARLKFEDYASSLGRDLGDPVAPADLSSHLARPLPELVRYGPAITEGRHALSDSFPDRFRAGAHAA